MSFFNQHFFSFALGAYLTDLMATTRIAKSAILKIFRFPQCAFVDWGHTVIGHGNILRYI